MLNVGPMKIRRPSAFKTTHQGGRDRAGNTRLSLGHLISNRSRLILERDRLLWEYRRIQNIVAGIDLAIDLVTRHS